MTATLTRVAFTAEAKALAAAAGWAAKHIPAKPAPAILGGILLDVADGRLRVSGFDYDVCAAADVAVDTGSPGRVLVSGRLFAELVKTLPAKPVTASADDAALTLRCGTVRLTLPLMVGEDYPALPENPAAIGTVDAQAFAVLAERVVVAADLRQERSLPALAGVHLAFAADGITAMASNRHRGTRGTVAWTPADAYLTDDASYVATPDGTGGMVPRSALVPGEVLAELARATDVPGELAIGLADGLVAFTGPGRSITARLLDTDKFPTNWVKMIPLRSEAPTVVTVADVQAAIKRAAMVLEPRGPVRLHFEDGTVTVSGAGLGDVGEDLACEHKGDPRDVAIRAEYLSDALAVLGTATAELTLPRTERQPLLVTAPGDVTYSHIIVPIRLPKAG